MKIPVWFNVTLLVVASTLFYTYVGQIVPQKGLVPPEVIEIDQSATPEDLVAIGAEIANGKGLCLTCHIMGDDQRFPDLSTIGSRGSRIEGMSDLDYLAQSLYEPDVYLVEGYNPGMPTMNKSPIGLTDEEILAVLAWLQSMGGEPTVTLQASHAYYDGGGGEE